MSTKYDLFLIFFLLFFTSYIHPKSTDLTKEEKCFSRCMGICYYKKKVDDVTKCMDMCRSYINPKLCPPGKDDCWDKCKDLDEPKKKSKKIESLKFVERSDYKLSFDVECDADILCIKINPEFGEIDPKNSFTCGTKIDFQAYSKPNETFCYELDAQMYSLAKDSSISIGKYFSVPKPVPKITEFTFSETTLNFDFKDFIQDDYKSNSSINVFVDYKLISQWQLGSSDLIISTQFHQQNCLLPDFTSAIPESYFQQGFRPNTLTSIIPGDLMYRSCTYVLFLNSIDSKQCHSPSRNDGNDNKYTTIDINCNSVKDSDCRRDPIKRGPVCNGVKSINYTLTTKNPKTDSTTPFYVNATFDFDKEFIQTNHPYYYIALYGKATEYTQSKLSAAITGVNMTSKMGVVNSCINFDNKTNKCTDTYPINSVLIPNITFDTIYGVTICIVVDQENTTLPDILSPEFGTRPRAELLLIKSADFKKNYVGLILGIIGGVIVLILIVLFIAGYCYYKKQQNKNKMNKLKLEMYKKDSMGRYKDFPKLNDNWELERRNLILYDDEVLGSGSFGVVIKGRLIGKAVGSKNGQSIVGTNIMRADNCDVAVKMLPAYTDDISKSDFLREIALMKKIGYHERLVNMLACITDSEPYCLVIEYCSDGDMLQFLRKRCVYMLKLNTDGVDYTNPDCVDEFDSNLICTLKQLLMFAVQISYGLEYLSSKGFVHRDVACRNVLVQDGKYAKIGDFGLCRFVYAGDANYKSHGGKLPIKWMAIEAIKNYEFTMSSDIWSIGILFWELITLGGTPYPGIQHDEMLKFLESGGRMPKPDNCTDEFYEVMALCWNEQPKARPTFSTIRQKLASQLESMTEEYAYLQLNSSRDYYSFTTQSESLDESQ